MAIELPRVLKNMNLFVDGRGYAGRIDEIQLPKLTLKTEEHRAGGMDLPVEIDLGMEKLEAELTIADGRVYFDFDFTAPYPAEHIVFRSHLVGDYLEEIL